MLLVGYKNHSFKGKDGALVSGTTLYLMEEERPDVKGNAVARVFLTDKKLGDYVPTICDDVTLVYNRYGKVSAVRLNQQVDPDDSALFV